MKHQAKPLLPMQVFPDPGSMGEIIEDLKKRGYQLQFRREAICLRCFEPDCEIPPDKFRVDEYYHFADTSTTDRERILYAVSSTEGLKGYLVEACFVYEDNISAEMTAKLKWEYPLT